MAVVGTLLAEEHRHPELLTAFRHRLVEPRRAALRRALAEGISSGELPDSADPEVLASMLIGSFYARYVATSDIPDDWAEQTLRQVWPDAPQRLAPGARLTWAASYHGTTPSSSWHVPVGPSAPSIASRTAITAPCSGGRCPGGR